MYRNKENKTSGLTLRSVSENSLALSDSLEIHGKWKPITLRIPFHAGVISICIFFIVLIQVLLARSNRDSGLLFADQHTGRLPNYALFCFEYLPTLLSVLHNLLWVSIDHDIKRFEPFFQLSKPGGALAEESLLLDYPFQYMFVVPVVSLRNRHWTVFLSSIITLFATVAVTPMMSAVLAHEPAVERNVNFEMLSHSLVPKEHQHEALSALFTYQIYGHKFLGRPAPRFTNDEFSIIPFTPKLKVSEYQQDEYWTVNTKLYESDLVCSTATQDQPNGTEWDNPVIVTNSEKDCSYTFKTSTDEASLVFDFSPYTGVFMSYGSVVQKNRMYMDADIKPSALSLSNTEHANCTRPNVMLAIWNKFPFYLDEKTGKLVQVGEYAKTRDKARIMAAGTIPNNFTAIFCEPRYYEQPVQAKIDAISGKIITKKSLGKRKSIFSAINSTFFEELVALGSKTPATPAFNVSNDHGQLDSNPFGIPNIISQLLHRPALTKIGNKTAGNFTGDGFDVEFNKNSIMGFAVADESNLDNLLSPDHYSMVLTRAFKQFFAYALTSELSRAPDPQKVPIEIGQRTFKTEAYIMDPLLSRLLQGMFVLFAILELLVIVNLYGRRLDLHSDVGSIAALMEAIALSPALLSDFSGSEFIPLKETKDKLRDGITFYSIRALQEGFGQRHRLEKVIVKDLSVKPLPHAPIVVDKNNVVAKPARPWELSIYTNSLALVCYFTLIGLFIAAFVSDKRYKGLPNLKTTFVRKLVYSYLPTVAATLSESFLTALARFVCLTAPYEEMWRGRASPSKSVMAHYERRSPHFLLFAAIKNSHYLLAVLITSIIAANALAIALGGIFLSGHKAELSWDAMYTASSEPFMNQYQSTLGNKSIPEREPAFYASLSDSNGKWTPSAWADEDYYFLPFTLAENDPQNRNVPRVYSSQTAETWGIGAEFKCSTISKENVSIVPVKAKRNMWGPHGGLESHMSLRVDASDHCKGLIWEVAPQADTRGTYDLIQRFIEADAVYSSLISTESLTSSCPGWMYASFAQYNIKINNITNQASQIEPPLGLGSVGGVDPNSDPRQVVATPNESTHVVCHYTPHTIRFNTTVAPNGSVLSRIATPAAQEPRNVGLQNLLSRLLDSLYTNEARADPRPQNFLSLLMTQDTPALATGTHSLATVSSDRDAISRAMERVLRRVFATYLKTYSTEFFVPSETSALIQGTLISPVARYRVSTLMTGIALGVLTLFTIVVSITYARRPGAFLPHIPTTIAATLPLLYASSALREIREKREIGKEGRWAYGWFVDRDGGVHVGVDREGAVEKRGSNGV